MIDSDHAKIEKLQSKIFRTTQKPYKSKAKKQIDNSNDTLITDIVSTQDYRPFKDMQMIPSFQINNYESVVSMTSPSIMAESFVGGMNHPASKKDPALY